MAEWQAKSDLCLAVGTSLSGFNVDSVAEAAIHKRAAGCGLGLVVINLQQTPYDDGCSLRIFARADDVLRMLAAELRLEPLPAESEFRPTLAPGSLVAEDVVRVPFDSLGAPCSNPERMEIWDLRLGQRLRLTGGPYEGDVGTVMEKSVDGHYRIRLADSMNTTFNVKRRPFSLWIGSWWLQQATHGFGLTPAGRIPFVNERVGST
uniref:Deacetylase sirtuin-type domain-containing protein n=2 Tax=Prymnesium polylepis TaxID=72548 RepID=A0A6T8BGH0_9EUKA|mmetsp:Transcript_25335/g.67912  ORF Transcript_25335/g.67912 Transcript_25335/m.67912 type:complete len:206 (+) Transcript_25335:703-1320(+)